MGEPTPPETGRPRWGVAAILTGGHFTSDFYALYLSALLPTLAARFGLTKAVAALLAATFSASASLSQPFAGLLGDRIHRHAAVVVSVVMSAVFLSLLATPDSLAVVVVLLILGGLGVSMFHPNAGVLVRKAAGPRAGTAMALFVAGGMAGVFAGPMFVKTFCAATGRLWLLPWSMALGLIVALATALTPIREPKTPAARPRLRHLFRRAHLPVYLLLAVGVGRAMSQIAFNNFLLFHAEDQGWSEQVGGLLLGGFLGAAALGAFAGGLLSDRVGRRPVIIASGLLGGAILFVAPQSHLAVAAGAAIVGGFCMGAGTPVCVVMAQELAPDHAGTMTGLMAGFAWGVGAFLVPIIGAVIDHHGTAVGLKAAAAILLAAGLLALALRETVHRANPLSAPLPPPPAE